MEKWQNLKYVLVVKTSLIYCVGEGRVFLIDEQTMRIDEAETIHERVLDISSFLSTYELASVIIKYHLLLKIEFIIDCGYFNYILRK